MPSLKDISLPDAVRVLKKAIQSDEDLAWTWHCNIATPFYDEGGTHEQANRAAARFMSTVFEVDVTKFDLWKVLELGWNKEVKKWPLG